MIHVFDALHRTLRIFPGIVWINPPHSCPAPCCDIACTCTPEMHCLHTSHPGSGLCIVNAQAQCLAWLPAGVTWTDCSCATIADCPHVRTLERIREQEYRQVGQALRSFKSKVSSSDLKLET